MKSVEKQRDSNLDLIRACAVLLVISVHFFLKSGFYTQQLIGKRMLIACICRSVCIVCVPLFCLLSGYLMNRKQLSNRYLKGIDRALVTYLVSTGFIILYKCIILKEDVSAFDIVNNVFTFQQYSWYIEMYIGLYFLIPFLNLLYNGLNTKKEKQFLLLVMSVLAMGSSIVNITEKWVLPGYWSDIYPISFFYWGTYLCEYRNDFQISWKKGLLLASVSAVISGVYCYKRSHGGVFQWGVWNAYGGICTFVTAITIFIFLLNIPMMKWRKITIRLITKISEVSLTLYLISWIVDDYVYKIFNSWIFDSYNRVLYFPIIVPIIFLISFILAVLVQKCCDFVLNKVRKIYVK